MKQLTERQLKNRIKKQLAEIEAHKAQKPVKQLTINMEWKKSRTWGSCPRAEALVEFKDGTFYRTGAKYYASGCGYCKESTVIADIFNDFLRYKLYQVHTPKAEYFRNGAKHDTPYGIYYYGGGYKAPTEAGEYYYTKPTYNGGVGTECYPRIAEFIGGKFERVASGKWFDVFKYTDGE